MLFQVTAIILLLVFYGCYFGKMFLQKRQGIQTDQIGKGKTGTAKVIETLMKITVGCDHGALALKNRVVENYDNISSSGRSYMYYKRKVLRYFGRNLR